MLDLTKTLASEFGSHGVRVNAVSPGAVISDAEDRLEQITTGFSRTSARRSASSPRRSRTWSSSSSRPPPTWSPARTSPSTAGGEPVAVVLTISDRVAEAAVVPELGGGLASYDLIEAGRRTPLFRPCRKLAGAGPFDLASTLLLPWSNRISGGGFRFAGKFHPLAPNCRASLIRFMETAFERVDRRDRGCGRRRAVAGVGWPRTFPLWSRAHPIS